MSNYSLVIDVICSEDEIVDSIKNNIIDSPSDLSKTNLINLNSKEYDTVFVTKGKSSECMKQ